MKQYNPCGGNIGYDNLGAGNIGDLNLGENNVGDSNTGDCNRGHLNTGDSNIGKNNTGVGNVGDYNTGNFNIGNNHTGCFNTIAPKIMLFNKQSDMTLDQWEASEIGSLLRTMPKLNDWIMWEKYRFDRGYLKQLTQEELYSKRQEWYDNLSDENKKLILSIPNFDADIFKQCTGIEVR